MALRDMPWIVKRGSDYVVVPWSRLVPPSQNKYGNTRKEGLTEETYAQRANSLVLEGQKTVVYGYVSDDGESFELTDGEIRYWGWKYAKEELSVDLDEKLGGVRCKTGPLKAGKPPEPHEIAYFQLSCGTDSVPLTNLDKATKVKELHEVHGQPIAEIARRMCCTGQTVRNLIKLASVDDGYKKAVKEKRMSPTTATMMQKASDDTKREVQEKLDRGEKVKGRDVEEKSDDLPKMLTSDEINKQIKKADAKYYKESTEKGRMYYKGMSNMAMIILGHKEKL